MVVSVAAERDALAGLLPADVELVVGGLGPAAAAAATARALPGAELVVCAGIGGGFAPLARGDVAIASEIVFADLGAETADGFVPVSELGFGGERYPVPAQLAVELADRTGGHLGTVLTVATVTGTSRTAAQLQTRFPDAVAEGMEGAGVAAAAALYGVPCVEIRAISNFVGPRDRSAWDLPRASDALGRAVAAALR